MINNVVIITTEEGRRFLGEMRKSRNIVAWLGSYISAWEPSNLPNGKQVTNDLAEVIAAEVVSPKEVVGRLIKGTAFEHIMERYPKRELLTKVFAKAYYPTTPNAVHLAYAYLIEQGVIDCIITTNYDVGLEVACDAICSPHRKPLIIVESNDGQPDDSSLGRPVIFKIHGCASPARQHTMVITLSEEGEIEEWKRRWLQKLINGKHLLVSGYSGLDFDLCAELALLDPISTSWNCYEDPREKLWALTDNAKRVVEAKNALVLAGDMRAMLHTLTGNCEAKDGAADSFVDELVRELEDEALLNTWRVGLFNGLGCAADALAVARRLPTTPPPRHLKTLMSLAEAQFHCGYYFQASRTYYAAAELARQLNLLEMQAKAQIGGAEADRVGGHLFRAWRHINKLEKEVLPKVKTEAREKVRAAITLKWVLLQRYPYHLLKYIPVLASWLRARVKGKLTLVAADAARRGNWFDFQHCEMQAKDYGLPFSKVYTGTLQPLAAREGFRQLGYVLAEMMAYRRNLASQTTHHDSELKPGLEYLEHAFQLGANPEIWKLAFIINRKFGCKALSRLQQRLAIKAWWACEYTWFMRVLLFFRGE